MKLTEKNAKFAVVRTVFHGGGVISYHKSLQAAERSARKWKSPYCCCGCCYVVNMAEYAALPTYQANGESPYQICK